MNRSEIIAEFRDLKAAYLAQAEYYTIYRYCAFANAAILVPVVCFTIWIVINNSAGLWKSYKLVVLQTLISASIGSLCMTTFFQPVFILPYIIVINLGPTVIFGPLTTLFFCTVSVTALFNSICGIGNAFTYNYLLVCHPTIQRRIESPRSVKTIIAIELLSLSVMVAACIFGASQDMKPYLELVGMDNLVTQYAAAGTYLPNGGYFQTFVRIMGAMLVGSAFAFIAMFLRTFIVLRRRTLHDRNNMHLNFLRVTMVNMVVPISLATVPFFIAGAFATASEKVTESAPLMLILEFMIESIPLGYCATYLAIVTTYRKAVLRIFQRNKISVPVVEATMASLPGNQGGLTAPRPPTPLLLRSMSPIERQRPATALHIKEILL